MKHLIFVLTAPILLLAACGPTPTPEPTAVPTLAATATSAPTPTLVPEGLTLYYEGNAQVELVSPGGARVMLDVYNPGGLLNPPEAQDILLSTHTHPDHYSKVFADSFPGKSMLMKAGDLDVADVKVHAMFSSGAYYQQQLPDQNTIYVIEIGGLRVAHLGDLAQTEFTPQQLELLKGVDILIFAFESQYGDMTLDNKNGFNLVAALQPKLVIPTHHTTSKGLEYAASLWGGFAAADMPLHISRADLPAETRLLVLGSTANAYKNLYKLADWPGATQ
jgi:L-ascorbate metabolism protein UlaG (beta-lactamase superfamily)